MLHFVGTTTAVAAAPSNLLTVALVQCCRTLFFGNYDVNVLDRVLQQLGLELHWCDLRDTTFELVDQDSCVGIVLNVKVQAGKMMSWMGGGRHWLVLRPFGKRWWNLDSLLLAPELVTAAAAAAGSGTAPLEPAEPTEATAGSAAAVRQFLALQLASRDAKVFRVAAAAAAAAADTLASHPLVDATAPGIPEDAPS